MAFVSFTLSLVLQLLNLRIIRAGEADSEMTMHTDAFASASSMQEQEFQKVHFHLLVFFI